MILINFFDNIDNKGKVLKTYFRNDKSFNSFLELYENMLEYKYFNYDILEITDNKELIKDRHYLNHSNKVLFSKFFKFMFREVGV